MDGDVCSEIMVAFPHLLNIIEKKREVGMMIKVTLGNISITKLGQSSAFFIGEKNKHRPFSSDQVRNDVVGTFSGNENATIGSYWINANHIGKE